MEFKVVQLMDSVNSPGVKSKEIVKIYGQLRKILYFCDIYDFYKNKCFPLTKRRYKRRFLIVNF